MPRPPDILISYARADRDQALALAGRLEARGYTAWMDRDLLPGEEWPARIERAIGSSRLVIVLWSDSAVRSRWCRAEAALAMEQGKYAAGRLDDGRPPFGFREAETPRIDPASGAGMAEFLAEIEVRLRAAAAEPEWSI